MEQRPLLNQVGFSSDKTPFLRNITNQAEEIIELDFNQPITISFDTSQHFCIGWRDMKTGERHACPFRATTEPKYEQCKECMEKTGFNPAFYHTTDISDAQADYNAQEHIVYLAHFAEGIIKVGITNIRRRYTRLLEQGARQALILDTFPSANVARQYEANISKLGFSENILLNRKLELLKHTYRHNQAEEELATAQTQIEQKLQTKFDQTELLDLDRYYFADGFDQTELINLIDMSEQAKISGQIRGLVGSILICRNDNDLLALPLKKFTGYYYNLSREVESVDTPTQQFGLF